MFDRIVSSWPRALWAFARFAPAMFLFLSWPFASVASVGGDGQEHPALFVLFLSCSIGAAACVAAALRAAKLVAADAESPSTPKAR